MKIIFEIGENRHVKLQIHSIKKQDFSILDASYELTKLGSTEPESTGNCTVYEHVIDSVISPKEKGIYHLKVTYHILDETLIDIVEVQVT